MRGFWWLTQFSSKYSTVKCNKWIAVRYDLKQYTRLINWQVWSLQISLYDWSERNWTVQFLIPSRDITDPARKTWPLGSFFFNLFHSLPFFITPSQNNLQINMLKKMRGFALISALFQNICISPSPLKHSLS